MVALVLAGTITARAHQGRKGVILSGFSGSTSIPPVHDNSDYKGYSSTIPIARFIDAILEPGKLINWNGKSVKLPQLKMCIFAGTNPFHRHQQINRIIEGWRKLETVIAIDNQWTSTCRFADIVLPATTQFERNNLDHYQQPLQPWHYRHETGRAAAVRGAQRL
ncbi:molybdopterin-dependent oxidoreductase [Escherichia coli]